VPTDEQNRVVHKTIQAVTRDLEEMGFNTAIARLMEFVNFFTKETVRPKSAMETLVLLLSPLAPHIGEELWRLLGHDGTLAYVPWPQFDEALTIDDTIEVPVQVNGKVRSKVSIAADASQDDMLNAAKADPKIAEAITGKQIVKSIVVPGRLVNLVVK
jgi:leucyl-tRNA synthetase